MSEPKRPESVIRARRWTFLSSAVLVAGAATVAAVVSAGADARSAATPVNTSLPVITGLAVVGETLSSSEGEWIPAPDSLAYQWQSCDADGASCAAIPGATSNAHVVANGDLGRTLRVQVTATSGADSASAVSAATTIVTQPTPPVNTTEPVISGSTVEGFPLTTTTGTWSGAGTIGYTYRWIRCGADGGLPDASDCPSIDGATSSSYTLTANDIGKRLRVRVTATSVAGPTTATSNPTGLVTQSTTTGPPVNTVEPSIGGTLVQGRLLFGSIGTWAGTTPLSYASQWMRCGGDGGQPDGSNCAAIGGADSSTYTLSADDVGSRMRFRVTASNSLGVQTVASNATAPIQSSSTTTPSQTPGNTRSPVIFGSAVRGETLTSTVGGWTGTTPLVFSYVWLRCPASGGQGTGSDCPAISGATGTQYVLTADDVGRRLRVQVTARNTLGSATAVSDPTALVQSTATTPNPPQPPPTTLPPGAIRLPNGKYSIPVTSVSAPERLVAEQVVFTPNPVRSRNRPLELRIRVLDSRGYVVRDALVFARSTPLLTSSPGEQPSGRDGWTRLSMTPRAAFPLGGGRNVQFFIRVRKPTDDLLTGVSSRRLVQVATAGSG